MRIEQKNLPIPLRRLIFHYICSDNHCKMRRNNIIESIRKAFSVFPFPVEVWLYGSEARGEARPDSDIDLLVLIDKPSVSDADENLVYTPLYQIELQTGVLINPLVLPKAQWGKRVTPFYVNVNNERVRI